MPLFERRHFEEAARLIRQAPEDQRESMTQAYLNMFRGSNPRFDEDRFLRASRGEPEPKRPRRKRGSGMFSGRDPIFGDTPGERAFMEHEEGRPKITHPTKQRVSGEPSTPAADMIGYGGRTDRTEAKHALDADGGVPQARYNSPFGRWLRKHEAHKEVMLTAPMTVEQPEKESPRNRIAEGAADIELVKAIEEEPNLERKKAMRRDARRPLIFREHSYLPRMAQHPDPSVRTRPDATTPIEPGAYERRSDRVPDSLSHYRSRGLFNMRNNPDVKN